MLVEAVTSGPRRRPAASSRSRRTGSAATPSGGSRWCARCSTRTGSRSTAPRCRRSPRRRSPRSPRRPRRTCRRPAMLASLLPELEARLHAFTWLGSVTGLSTPAPSFAQHLASLAPGSAFGVSSYPEPSVSRLRRDGPTVPLPELAGPHRLVVAPRGGDVDWVLRTLNPALGNARRAPRSSRRRGGPEWWGTAKLVESVAIPLDVERLAGELVAGLDPWTCRWCRELVARSPCPLCGHRGRPARRRAAAGRRPRPTRRPTSSAGRSGAQASARRRQPRRGLDRAIVRDDLAAVEEAPRRARDRLRQADRRPHVDLLALRARRVAQHAAHAAGRLGAGVVPARPLQVLQPSAARERRARRAGSPSAPRGRRPRPRRRRAARAAPRPAAPRARRRSAAGRRSR